MTSHDTTGTRIDRRDFLRMSAAGVAASMFSCRTRSATTSRYPNIVVILADDMGVGDVQALYPPGKLPSPYLDRFASEGMMFTDAHSGSAVCTPTRYGILTGRYAWRTCLQEWVIDVYEPPLIARDRLTLPRLLQQQGYHTACIGKWHLGWDWSGKGVARERKPDFTKPIASGPTTRGFDYYFGTDVPNFPPFTFIENDRIVTQPTAQNVADKEMHIGFDGAPMAPGWRFDEILPTVTTRAVDYIHERATTNAPFFLYFSMTTPHEPIAPSERFKGKSGIAPIGDLVMETDWSAGQVIQALEDAGVADNTLVIFTADNGHSHYTGWDKLVEAGHMPSGPFRGHKADIWEGGHRVPFIVRWPGHVEAGVTNDSLICLTDIMATCAAVVGEQLPDSAGEDSINMLPAFEHATSEPIRNAIVHHDRWGRFAIRQEPWKLVILAEKDKEPDLQLYNIDEDAGETTDVSDAHPDRVESLLALLNDCVAKGRSTPGADQPNDTLDIDVMHLPPKRWARPR